MGAGPTGVVTTIRDRILVNPLKLPLLTKLGLLGFLGLAVVPIPVALASRQVAGLTVVLYIMMFAMTWDFASGYTGHLSLGHTLFFTLGGFGSALLNLEFGLSPAVGIPVGMLLAALAALVVGLPTLRLGGDYFAVVTLVVPLALLQVFVVFGDTFGGRSGLAQPDPFVGTGSAAAIQVSGWETVDIVGVLNYYVSFALFGLMLAVMLAITRSEIGEVFTAIHADERVVGSIGIDPLKFKTFAFVLGAAAGGLAGAMFVHTVGTPHPELLLGPDVAVQVVVLSVIGGMGTIIGAVLGALVFAVTDAVLGAIPLTLPVVGGAPDELMPLPIYVVAGFVLLYRPAGIYGWIRARFGRNQRDDPPGNERPRTGLALMVVNAVQTLRERL